MKKLFFTLLALSLSASCFALAPSHSNLEQEPKTQELNLSDPSQHVADSVIFLSPEEEFEKAGISAKDLAKTIAAILILVNKTYQDSPPGAVNIYIELSAIKKPQAVCQRDYTQCVLMGFLTDNQGDEKLYDILNKKLLDIQEVPMKNNHYTGKLSLLLHINYPSIK